MNGRYTSCTRDAGDVQRQGILFLFGGVEGILRRVCGKIIERSQASCLCGLHVDMLLEGFVDVGC